MRSTARGVAALAIVLLAVVAAPRLSLDYTPRTAASEIIAAIRFPTAASGDPVDMTTRWVVPLETAVRSLGDVIATRGEVGADGATLTIRFRRGVDADLKAARLAAELAPLRARLPEGASIGVWPATDSGNDPSAVFALSGVGEGRAAERVVEALRATSGVRDVTMFGATDEEIDVRAFVPITGDLGAAIVSALAPRMIGRAPFAGRDVAVVAAPSTTNLRDVRISGQRLESIATIRQRRAEPRFIARLDGKPAVVAQIVRDDDVSLFAFDRNIRAALRAASVTSTDLWSDASELRALLWRLALAALLATIALSFAGHRSLAIYILLAIAIAVNIWRIAALRVDALGLQATVIAIAGLAPIAVWRRRARWPLVLALFFALLPLVATALASNALAAILLVPARMFAIAACAAIGAMLLLPPERRLPQRGAGSQPAKHLLRASFAIVLAAVATATFLLAWFGKNLDPRHATGSVDRKHLFVHLALPVGTPLAPTVDALARIERGLRGVDGIARLWSYASPGRGTVVIDVAPSAQSQDAIQLLELRVQAAIPFPRAMARVGESFGRRTRSGSDTLEERPDADEQGFVYRVLLKGTDGDALRRAMEMIIARLGRQDFHRGAIVSEWPEASTQVTLVPRPGIDPQVAATMANALAVHSTPPRERVLPDGRTLVAAPLEAPKNDDDIPFAAPLFRTPLPLTAESAFDIRELPVSGRATRELGRFVMPVTIGIHGWDQGSRNSTRESADRTLSVMTLPPGVVLERPPLSKSAFTAEKFRLIGLAALLPSMIFALAAIALSSLRRALVALTPAVVGIACTSPILLAFDASMDEVVLLAIGAAVCCVTAMTTAVMLRFHGTAATYRELRRSFAAGAVAAGAAALMTGVAATAGGGLGDVWRAPLIAAAIVFAAGGGCALILPAAIEAVARRMVRPETSPPFGEVILDVQNLTKIYASGFRALHRVSFTLQPGIVGLLGPNGAGKTTLLRIVTGLLLPTRGVVRFRGVEVRPSTLAAYRTQIGFLPQEFNAYAGLTAEQFLDFWALERGITEPRARRKEVERLLRIARLEEHAGRKLRDFSGGMRQRIGIARAMTGDPPLLVVDEPTTGLDIEARAHFREIITALGRDRIIILSTHIASDVESTASRLLLLAGGKLCWDGTPEALIARGRGRVFETITDDNEAIDLAKRYRITTRIRTAAGIRLRGVVPPSDALPGAEVEPTLEEAYLAEVAPARTSRSASFAFVYES